MEQTLPLELERYRLREKIGQGGMGEVYLASDTLLERDVAIKLVHHERLEDSDARRLFRREARATARLEHPGIVRIYDLLEPEEHDYIVMEHLKGQTLADTLADSPLEPARALPLFHDVADSLAHAHAKGIVHRDLKPGNIWITPEGQVKLLDFGLAKQVESDETSLLQGQLVGTARYMSPEQARGKDLDHRSDLFSFGVVLYQALTGETPFSGKTLAECLANTITEQHVPAVGRNPEVPRSRRMPRSRRPAAASRWPTTSTACSTPSTNSSWLSLVKDGSARPRSSSSFIAKSTATTTATTKRAWRATWGMS